MICERCEGCSWVCEQHPDKPMEGPHACNCGCTAGMPCPLCNSSTDIDPPRMPEGFIEDGEEPTRH